MHIYIYVQFKHTFFEGGKLYNKNYMHILIRKRWFIFIIDFLEIIIFKFAENF
jgi:hypothetical protein